MGVTPYYLYSIDCQQYRNTKTPNLISNCNKLILIIRQKKPILSYKRTTAFTAFTFFLKPLS